jgi:SAM-dependent methyltransferase
MKMSDTPRSGIGRFEEPPEQILDATCGGRSIWLPENKERDDALYIDSRREEKGFVDEAVPESLRPNNPNYSVEPDDIQDFRDLPYPDESFNLAVFDPPHIIRSDGMETLTGVMTKKYGCLHAETWQDDLRRGFDELFRVLSPGGTLVFKFADMDTDFSTVLDLAPKEPLFGTTTKNKKNHETRWFVFYKSERNNRCVEPDTDRRENDE